MRRLLFVLAAAGAGCGWPAHHFAVADEPDGSALDGSMDEVSTDVGLPVDDTADLPPQTSCAPSADSAGLCAELRDFNGAFALDGAGDEFCRAGAPLPPRRFTLSESARTSPFPAPSGLTERFEVRAGIDAFGLHVFVQVLGDPRVVVDRADPTQGDAVEIFLRGNVARDLTGGLEADEAHHLVLSPPSATAPGVGFRYLGGVPKTPLSDSYWRSRRVKGGWEVELHYPWTVLQNQASPGMILGFDIALDLDDDPTHAGRDVRAIMHLEPVSSSPACAALSVDPADPFCDDRTWCLAKAYIP